MAATYDLQTRYHQERKHTKKGKRKNNTTIEPKVEGIEKTKTTKEDEKDAIVLNKIKDSITKSYHDPNRLPLAKAPNW